MIANAIKIKCYHCGDFCAEKGINIQEKHFCCNGCKTVYGILSENNLCEYYDFKAYPGLPPKKGFRENKFAFLDNADIASKIIQYSRVNHANCTLYIPQIHCSSCLWVLEHLNRLDEGILSSRVNFERKELFINFDSAQTSLRAVVELLSSLGYEPHLELDRQKPNRYSKKSIYKLGIAGFCFSNIMMLSFPEYLSSQGEVSQDLRTAFRAISIGLSLPVLFYCASDIFKSAYSGLKNRIVNIDLPVAIAVVITFFRSLFEMAYNISGGYLDSMSGIVFFLLIGRWLQNKTYENITFERNYSSYFPIAVDRRSAGVISPIQIDCVAKGDELLIHHNEIVPVDTLLSKGEALIDYSFVSGETTPVRIEKGSPIYAGGRQIAGLIEVVATKRASQSYLTSLWNNNDKKPHHNVVKRREDVISRYFTFFVLTLALMAAAYWYTQSQFTTMWNALTTILIVACPCALLLASNFTNGYTIRILGRNRFYIKNIDVLYKLQQITHIVFDKTGTLTRSGKAKVRYHGAQLTERDLANIASLLAQSLHPISKTILKAIGYKDYKSVVHYKETQGQGVEGWIDETYYKLGAQSFVCSQKQTHHQASLYIAINGDYVGKYELKNKYRKGAFRMLKTLKSLYKIALLSGDNDSEKSRIQQKLGSDVPLYFEQTPEDKLRYVEYLQLQEKATVLMVGDGLNDMLSLKRSDVGVSVSDQNNVFTPSADAILEAKNVSRISHFIGFTKKSKLTVWVCFGLSVGYNIIGLFYAMQGLLKPILAAILMMMSSISIMLVSYLLTQLWSKRIKLL